MNSEFTPDLDTTRSTIRALSGWTDLNDEAKKNLDAILDTVTDTKFSGAIIPVLVRNPSPEMIYYGVARTDIEWRGLRPLISASVGISYSDFTGIAANFEPTSDLERVLVANGYTKFSKFGAHGNKQLGKDLANSLLRLVNAVASRPTTPSLAITTTAQLVSEFDMALEYRQHQQCNDILAELSNNLRLDQMNIRFLRTRMHARFGEWSELVNEPYFPSLTIHRRPARISADLVEAIYKTRFASFESSDDAKGAVDHFRSDVIDISGNLFDRILPSASPDVVKCFLIAELSQSNPNFEEIQHLKSLAIDWRETDKVFFGSLVKLAPTPVVDEPIRTNLIEAKLAILQSMTEPSDDQREIVIKLVEELEDSERVELYNNNATAED